MPVAANDPADIPFAQLKIRADRLMREFQTALRTHQVLKAECDSLQTAIRKPEVDDQAAVPALADDLAAVSAIHSKISVSGCSDSDRQVLEAGLKRLHKSLVTVGICEPENGLDHRLPAPLNQQVPTAGVLPGNESATLTHREHLVLQYIVAGYSTKQVAVALGIAFKTVACHRYRLMDKLDIHDTATLVRYAIRVGLVPA